MKNKRLVVIPILTVGLGLILLPACSKGVQEGAPPSATDTARPAAPDAAATPTARTDEPVASEPNGAAMNDDPTVIAFHGLTSSKPESWEPAPPENSMQTARYIVPGPDGEEPAALVIFFFGTGKGGSIEDNIDRWAGQFLTLEGGPVEPKIETFEANGLPVTLVELRGTYLGAGIPEPQSDKLFLSAIVEASIGRIFIRLVGPAATVEVNRQAYLDLINGLKAG